MNKLYGDICKRQKEGLARGEYFYVSRSAVSSASVFSMDDIGVFSNFVEKNELAPAEEISYFASATSEGGDNSDYEGYKFSSVKINGLKTLSSKDVLSCIDTEEGSLFNSDILQRDLLQYSAFRIYLQTSCTRCLQMRWLRQ